MSLIGLDCHRAQRTRSLYQGCRWNQTEANCFHSEKWPQWRLIFALQSAWAVRWRQLYQS